MALEFKRLSDVQEVAEFPEGAKAIINDNGTIKQCPSAGSSGAGVPIIHATATIDLSESPQMPAGWHLYDINIEEPLEEIFALAEEGPVICKLDVTAEAGYYNSASFIYTQYLNINQITKMENGSNNFTCIVFSNTVLAPYTDGGSSLTIIDGVVPSPEWQMPFYEGYSMPNFMGFFMPLR